VAKRASAALDLGLVRDLTLPHLDAAYNLARWIIGTDEDAADVVHTAFLRAARYVHTYAGGNARAWWLSIVRNCCLATLGARSKREVSLESLETDDPDFERRSDDSIEESLHLSQSAALILKELQAIPVEYREVLVLRELEDCSYREIADILSVPIGTVMSRLARARSLIRKALMETSGQGNRHEL
jgi:RNA polymerase sigma-70 factor (ECF subfamily)